MIAHRHALALAALLTLAAAARAAAGGPPHHMLKADGSLDMTVCGVCHNPDMSLQRSKLETCTLCHPQTTHAGSSEHVQAPADAVKRALANQPKGGPTLPLAEKGTIYCGTCHLYHDPKVMEENWLGQGWLPADGGLSGAVREAVIQRWAALAAAAADKGPLGRFAATGTRQLRLPVDAGQLCLQCHGGTQ